MRCGKKACAALAAFLILAVPTVACSQKNGSGDQQSGAVSGAQASGAGSSGRTVLVGKVTAVVGNQVTLAVGKLNGGSGFRKRDGGASGISSETVSSAAGDSVSSASSSASSSLITLTGEKQTVLIPVGLKLSSGFSGGAGSGSGQRRTSSGSASGMPEGGFGGGAAPQGGNGQTGGSASRSGMTGRSSGSGGASGRSFGGTAGGSAGAGAAAQQRSSDFSSITAGMILQITEETLSDGTQGIVSVSVLSK